LDIRLFLNDAVQIRFPWDFVLKPSDGRWEAPRKLRVSLISGDANDFASQRIQQIEEYGLATVTKVERKVYADQTIFELTILRGNTVGDFKVGNRVTTEDRSIEAEIYNSTSKVVVETPGTDYEVGDRIRLKGRSRISFEARVTETNENGGILGVDLIDFGSGTTPNHILDVQGSGRFFLDRFTVFQYLEDNRELDVSDNLDVPTETLDIFSQNYTEGSYFLRAYTSRTIGFQQTYVDPSFFNEEYVLTPILAINIEESFTGSTVDNPLTNDSILTTPADPAGALNFVVDTVDGSGATFSLEFSPIVEEAGYYDGVRGQLSESIVLQDSEFYQKFSYEIITAYPINEWIDPLKNHVHPAGTKPFGLINRIERIDSSTDILTLTNVIELPPQDTLVTSQFVSKTFTKILGDCAVCTDDASVLSQEDISFTKRLSNSASTTGFGKVLIQNYVDGYYFSEDYVSKKIGFDQDYASETFFSGEYVGNAILAETTTF